MTKSLTQEIQERIDELNECRIKYERGSGERFIFLTRIDELQTTLKLIQKKIGQLKEIMHYLPDDNSVKVSHKLIDKILGGEK